MNHIFKIPKKDFITKGNGYGILTNGYGSYYCIHPELSYQGWYQLQTKKWRMQKIIESITPLDEGKQLSTYQQFYGIRRLFYSKAQDTIIPYQKVLLYKTHKMNGRVLIKFDHRETYEQSRLGRSYELKITKDFVLIKFTQKNEIGEIEYEHFVGIKGIRNITSLNNWVKKEYSVDKKRNAQSIYWINELLTFIPTHHVVISSGESESEARTLADIAYFHFDGILSNLHEKSLGKLYSFDEAKGDELKVATKNASWALLSLLQKFSFDHKIIEGIYAGLPWFFQIWSRDELISLGGLLSLAKKENKYLVTIKNILSRHILGINKNGKLENRFPKSMLGSIDSFGWLAKRIIDFINLTKQEKQIYTLFNLEELIQWYNALKQGLENAKRSYGIKIDDVMLFGNESKETWMDTSFEDCGRKGLRIEIQALFYGVYNALNVLGKLIDSKDVFELHREQNNFKKAVRKKFLKYDFEGLLIDGIVDGRIDKTYRPNVFLAAYVAKGLLTSKEWKQVFDVYLKKLYLNWGGISTIGKSDSRFHPNYTGEDNKSYHRGDSWYFVNNIVAQVLFEIDEDKYSKEINNILQASMRDILEEGFISHSSELSSASVQEANASLAQAWSSATFIELVDKLYPTE